MRVKICFWKSRNSEKKTHNQCLPRISPVFSQLRSRKLIAMIVFLIESKLSVADEVRAMARLQRYGVVRRSSAALLFGHEETIDFSLHISIRGRSGSSMGLRQVVTRTFVWFPLVGVQLAVTRVLIWID